MDVGKIIKEKRSEKNMTQEDLANEFFVSRQLISKWENGKSYPDLEQLLKLSDFFDLTLDELMRGDKKMTKKINMTIKRKPIMIGIIAMLSIIIIFIGFAIWSEQSVQLKPSDIEITSIKIEENPRVETVNVDTKEKVVLPKDLSYTIKFKVKKPFTNMLTGHYFDQDKDSIYLDMRGRNSLFPSKDEKTFIIPSDSKLYEESGNLEIDENYMPKIVKDKDIKIIDIDNLDESSSELSASTKNWILIKKSELKK